MQTLLRLMKMMCGNMKKLSTEIKKWLSKLDKEYDVEDLSNVVLSILWCYNCEKLFIKPISFEDSYNGEKNDDMKLHIHSCVSGGIYKVYFQCPECSNEIDVIK